MAWLTKWVISKPLGPDDIHPVFFKEIKDEIVKIG